MTRSEEGLRFLGFAFAASDLLFEIDSRGIITLDLGAAKKVTGVGNVILTHNSWRILFEPSDHGVFSALINSLTDAGRKGPVRLRLKHIPGQPPRYADVFACRLPQLGPNVSCALSLSLKANSDDATDGLMDRAAFEKAISRLMCDAKGVGINADLVLVEVTGLARVTDRLSTRDPEGVVQSLSDILRVESLRGAAARLGDENFAVVREKSGAGDTLEGRLKSAAQESGANVEVHTAVVALAGASETAQTLRALRFTLDHFLEKATLEGTDMTAVFRRQLDSTLRDARSFTELVNARRFKLVYQPIVDLNTREVQHYEALVRFAEDESPSAKIRMAEELELIEELDLAVAQMAIGMLLAHGPEVRIAVNLSGRSFLRPKFLDRLLALTADTRLRNRLMFEITESAALTNLELSEERIQRLRREGFSVCIGNFGSGAASLSYLRNLTIDVVKIDGQYVSQVEGGGRDVTVVRHLTALCRELGVRTIAEMVETESALTKLKELGVEMGQGYFFSPPLTQIPLSAPRRRARRAGTVESWG